MNLLNQFEKKLPANINNTNNNNNTNNTNDNINNTTLCLESNEIGNETASLPLGKPIEEDIVSQKKVVKRLPPAWKGVKCDLYVNGENKDGSPSMKINIGVIRRIDGAQVALQASLNSTWDDGVRRGVDKNDWMNSRHWIRVKQHRKELEYLYDIRASKIGLKQKSGGTEMVAFVYCIDTTWYTDIVREGEIYTVKLDNELSINAHANQIATGYAGERGKGLIKPKELGI